MTKNDFIQRAVLALLTKYGFPDTTDSIERRIREAQLHAGTLQNLGFSFSPEGATDDTAELKEQLKLSKRFCDMYEKVADTGVEALNRLKTVLGEHPRARTNPIYRKIEEIVEKAIQDVKNTINGMPLP